MKITNIQYQAVGQAGYKSRLHMHQPGNRYYIKGVAKLLNDSKKGWLKCGNPPVLQTCKCGPGLKRFPVTYPNGKKSTFCKKK